jgi:hypothetical protein
MPRVVGYGPGDIQVPAGLRVQDRLRDWHLMRWTVVQISQYPIYASKRFTKCDSRLLETVVTACRPGPYLRDANVQPLAFGLRADFSRSRQTSLLDPCRILQSPGDVLVHPALLRQGFRRFRPVRCPACHRPEKTRATTEPALACNATHGLDDTISVAPNHGSENTLFW